MAKDTWVIPVHVSDNVCQNMGGFLTFQEHCIIELCRKRTTRGPEQWLEYGLHKCGVKQPSNVRHRSP